MENSLLIGQFVTISFGKRLFYLPHVPSNVYIYDNNRLEILFADMDSYAIVDGIRCYYHIDYEADKDMIHTYLKDFDIEGLPFPEVYPLSFPVTAQKFPLGKRDKREIVPKRDYSEVTSAYLSERKNFDKRVISFLENHPEWFEQVETMDYWRKLNKELSVTDDEPFILSDFPKHIADAFREEMGF